MHRLRDRGDGLFHGSLPHAKHQAQCVVSPRSTHGRPVPRHSGPDPPTVADVPRRLDPHPLILVDTLSREQRADFASALHRRARTTWSGLNGPELETMRKGSIKPTVPEQFKDTDKFIVLRYSGKLPVVGVRRLTQSWIESAFGKVYDHGCAPETTCFQPPLPAPLVDPATPPRRRPTCGPPPAGATPRTR